MNALLERVQLNHQRYWFTAPEDAKKLLKYVEELEDKLTELTETKDSLEWLEGIFDDLSTKYLELRESGSAGENLYQAWRRQQDELLALRVKHEVLGRWSECQSRAYSDLYNSMVESRRPTTDKPSANSYLSGGR